jgi:hypothetical protein
MRRLALTAALLGLSSCSDGTAPGFALLHNRARWEAAGITTYTLVVTRSCFCDTGALGPVTIDVVNGAVMSRRYTQTGAAVPDEYDELFPIVPQLFELIESSIRLHPDRLDVTYHAVNGYPEHIFVDFSHNVADEEFGLAAVLLLPEALSDG